MKKLNIIILIAVFFMMAMTGDAHSFAMTKKTKVVKKAFGAEKRYAIVTIASIKDFYGEKGMLQSMKKNENIPGKNTQPLVDELSSQVIETLGNSPHFTLVPESEVLGSEAYKNAVEDPYMKKVFKFAEFETVPANKYKYFSDPETLAKLAEELDVDGVISIVFGFSILTKKSMFAINGIGLGRKKSSVLATMWTVAYNQKGKRVLRDTTVRRAETGDKKTSLVIDGLDLTDTKFLKLHPSALTIGAKAIVGMHDRVSRVIGGKKSHTFQRVQPK